MKQTIEFTAISIRTVMDTNPNEALAFENLMDKVQYEVKLAIKGDRRKASFHLIQCEASLGGTWSVGRSNFHLFRPVYVNLDKELKARGFKLNYAWKSGDDKYSPKYEDVGDNMDACFEGFKKNGEESHGWFSSTSKQYSLEIRMTISW